MINSPYTERIVPAHVQDQWAKMAAIEAAGHAVVRRDLDSYLLKLGGLAHLIDYVAQSGRGDVIDIGAGQAVAVNQLAQHRMGRALRYLATGIVKPPDYDGNVPYLQTGAEALEGIDSQSAGGVFAVHSIIFSVAPDMVVEALDKVLVAGGVVKTNLVLSQAGNYVPPSQGAFLPAFEAKGYDTAVDPSGKVLLAMKPGGVLDVDASTLLHADLQTYEHQRAILRGNL